MMTIAIGNDHAAPQLKKAVMEHLEGNGFEVIDVGCAEGEKCDYPDSARKVCDLIRGGEAMLGILICGTGVGIQVVIHGLYKSVHIISDGKMGI